MYMRGFVECSTATVAFFFFLFNHHVAFDIINSPPCFSPYYTLKLMSRRAPVARQAISSAPESSAPVLTTRSGRQPTLSKKQQENGV
jgi:hypothetical protein